MGKKKDTSKGKRANTSAISLPLEDKKLSLKVRSREETEPLPVVNINTGGGAYIAGNVSTIGGDFTGRDQVREQEEKPGQQQPAEKAPVFLPSRHPFEPEMAVVAAGEFWMGSDEDNIDASEDEKPLHKVWLDEYLIGRYPVTVAQYRVFVEQSGYKTKGSIFLKNNTWQTPQGKNSNIIGKDNHPVTCVNWNDAREYCRWLSEKTGYKYGLPSEAQWEKAARGTDGRTYTWGNTPLDKTNITCNIGKWFIDTTPVGQFSPAGDSPYGCSDIVGNIWEWCADWYVSQYYVVSPSRNPICEKRSFLMGLIGMIGPMGPVRCRRGGSWKTTELRFARCARRDWGIPFDSGDNTGFRVVSLR